MQLATHEKMIERFWYYWAKMYVANLKVGNDYRKLRKNYKYYHSRRGD